MKKLLLAGNLVLMSVLWFQSCKNSQTVNPDATSACNTICSDYSNKTYTGIDAGLVTKMIGNYKTGHYNAFVNNTRPVDARSIWFSLDRLKQFIYEIEKNTCKKGCNTADSLGLRVYFAEYPNAQEEWNKYPQLVNELPEIYRGKHTLLMVPTIRMAGVNTDFDPRAWGNNCSPESMESVMRKLLKGKGGTTVSDNMAFVFTPGSGDPTLSLNHGTLDPPTEDDPIAGRVRRPCRGSLLMNYVDGINCNTINPGPLGPASSEINQAH